MSVEPLCQRCPDRSSKIPAQVRNPQNQTCVGRVARRAMIENMRTHPHTSAVCLETARCLSTVQPNTWSKLRTGLIKALRIRPWSFRPRLDLHSSVRTPGIFARKTPLTKQRAPDRNECD